ncbi:MAG TPA: hypothetical protein DCQ06_02295 [Myxococcales bacterium]|nr:hypothetical protein [Myxococcales bacterium]HAN30405.1 hypothetical protein [Myxococcales bacterium]|tara:strand:+ start:927 stop:1526 length:600 start_codon:yes stop_codon:yes gene_type:complete
MNSDSSTEQDKELGELRAIVWRTVAGIVLLVVVVIILALWYREPLLRFSHRFVEELGPYGVALGYLLPDGFAIPILQDAVMAIALIGGMSFSQVALWSCVGSLVGGACGFFIGRNLSRLPLARRILARHGARVTALMDRYGAAGLAIGALTPLPYCLCCWAAGGLGMRFGTFALISLLRVPRVLLYLWLIELGALTVLG